MGPTQLVAFRRAGPPAGFRVGVETNDSGDEPRYHETDAVSPIPMLVAEIWTT
jgi:hypothetical protein